MRDLGCSKAISAVSCALCRADKTVGTPFGSAHVEDAQNERISYAKRRFQSEDMEHLPNKDVFIEFGDSDRTAGRGT